MKLSIIVPVFNEERTVRNVVESLKSVALNGLEKEIIIVNDGSYDNTASELKDYVHDPQVRIFHQDKNYGKTAALKLGIQQASGDIIIIQDADLEYNPKDIAKLVDPIMTGKEEVVFGSRFKGSIKSMKFINRCANRLSNIIFNACYPVKLTDINTCYKAFKKEIIKSINIESKQFTFETEVTAKIVNRGHRILELPIDYVARSDADGKKINWSKAIQMFWGIFQFKSSK